MWHAHPTQTRIDDDMPNMWHYIMECTLDWNASPFILVFQGHEILNKFLKITFYYNDKMKNILKTITVDLHNVLMLHSTLIE